MQLLPNFNFEKEYLSNFPGKVIIGVDEAGRGPLAGPVVAACAHYRRDDFSVPENLAKEFAFIRDSKTLSEKKREQMFELIEANFDYGIGIIHPETIDRVNILQATFLAMKEAIGEIKRKLTSGDSLQPNSSLDQRILLFIDGNQTVPNVSLKQQAVVSGDARVKTIAAASIVAKVTRDRMMNEYDALYPQYGFAKHKGYGTKTHMDALKKYGPTPVHRLSFAPVRQALLEFREFGILPDEM